MSDRVLVIKHGALGDFILATGPFAAIRAHHLGSHVVLLTTRPFAALADASGYFNEVWVDERPPLWRIGAVLGLRHRLNAGRFTHVYDLQTSDRSSFYFRLLRRPRPLWSGIARGASHPHANPDRDRMHTLDRQREQLEMAGIVNVPPPNLDWLAADIGKFAAGDRYALLVPGGSAHRPGKRWPADRYAALAGRLAARAIRPVLLGAGAEEGLLAEITAACPGTLNLVGKTSFAEIAQLARGAVAAIGNDTGPMHIIAAAGCRSLVLFSHGSDPKLCAPRSPNVTVLRRERLADLAVDEVTDAL